MEFCKCGVYDGGVTKEPTASARPTGRRTGDSGTREAIYQAALACFAREGFKGATLRTIAADAEVDPALIRHFLGSKQDLFDAVIISALENVGDALAQALPGDPQRRGERVVNAYLDAWEDPISGLALVAVLRSVVAAEGTGDLVWKTLGQRLRTALELSGANTSVEDLLLRGPQLFGVAVLRYVVQLPEIAQMDRETLVSRLAPTFQDIFGPGE